MRQTSADFHIKHHHIRLDLNLSLKQPRHRVESKNNKSPQIYRSKNPATFSEESFHSMTILNISSYIKPASVLKVTSRRILTVCYQVIKCLSHYESQTAPFIYLSAVWEAGHTEKLETFFYANISTRLFPAGLVFVDLDVTDLNSSGKTNTNVF